MRSSEALPLLSFKSTPPQNPHSGDVYFDRELDLTRVWSKGSWVVLSNVPDDPITPPIKDPQHYKCESCGASISAFQRQCSYCRSMISW